MPTEVSIEERIAKHTHAARQHFEEVWNEPIAAKQNWQRIAFLEAIALTVAICWVGYLGKLPKQIPYVLERDKDTVSYIPAQPADMSDKTWNQVKVDKLKRFLECWRTVSFDRTAIANNWDAAFAYIGAGSKAEKALDEFYKENDPIQRLNSGQLVSVQYVSFNVAGDHTLILWWDETTTSLDGRVISKKRWQMRAVYILKIPNDEKARRENGLGMTIVDLNWEEA